MAAMLVSDENNGGAFGVAEGGREASQRSDQSSLFQNGNIQEPKLTESESSFESRSIGNDEEGRSLSAEASAGSMHSAPRMDSTDSALLSPTFLPTTRTIPTSVPPAGVCVTRLADTSEVHVFSTITHEEEQRKPSRCRQHVALWCPALFLFVLVAIAAVLIKCLVVDKNEQGHHGAEKSATGSGSFSPPETYTIETKNEMFLHLRSILGDFTDPNKFFNPDSAQSRALAWLVTVEQDPSTRTWYSDQGMEDYLPRLLQRYALIVLAYSCGGDNWRSVKSWMSQAEVHECDWELISCDPTTRMVTNLKLESRSLTGSLPQHEIGLLTHLKELDVASNRLQGNFPAKTVFSKLSNLESLRLYNNPHQFFSLPTEIGLLSNSLQLLSLGSNLVTGTLPQEFRLLTSLRLLDLSKTQLSGHLSDFLPFLPDLSALYLAFTNIRGDALSYQYTYSTWNMTYLDVRGLQDVTTIPTTVGLMSNLKLLWLGDNPDLRGTLPSEFVLCTSLSYLHVDDSSIEGTIPTELGDMPKLSTLSLSLNRLHGTVPSEFGRLSSLTALALTLNSLTGTLPTLLGYLPHLEILDVSGNAGLDIPNELCQPGIDILYSCKQICSCCENSCMGYGQY